MKVMLKEIKVEKWWLSLHFNRGIFDLRLPVRTKKIETIETPLHEGIKIYFGIFEIDLLIGSSWEEVNHVLETLDHFGKLR